METQTHGAEKHVIGAMLFTDYGLSYGVKALEESDFLIHKHLRIFQACKILFSERKSADAVSVCEQLKKTGNFGEVGEAYLMEIICEVVSDANIKTHCEILKEKSALRRLVSLSGEILKSGDDGDLRGVISTLDLEIKKAKEKISGVPVLEKGVSIVSPDNLVGDAVSLYNAPYYRGESTGWENLDKCFMVEKGQMNILFGVPSHGKSSFMDAMMMNLALRSKWKVLVFSPENKSAAYHTSKLCEIATGKPVHSFYGGPPRMTEDEYLKASTWVSRHFVFLSVKDGGASLDSVLEKVKEIKPDMVVVDPWNRMDHFRPDGMTETEHIGQCLAKTSAMTKVLNISFWFVVHPQKLRRDKEGNVIRPGFYEVSGSAHWSNMADNGILVWRDFENNTTEVETVKVRYRHNGNVGVSYMKFDRASGRFSSDSGFMPNDYKKQAGGDK